MRELVGQKALVTKPDNSDSGKVFADFHAHRTVTVNRKRNLSDGSIEAAKPTGRACAGRSRLQRM